MKVMDRFKLINIINQLQEYNLMTVLQAEKLLEKRDNQARRFVKDENN